MPGTAAGGTGSGRKRWGWTALVAGAFLAGLLLVGVALIRAPETERPAGDNLANSPAAIPASAVPSDNGATGPAPGPPGPRLAIVVDDLGYDPVRDAEWLDFPERITVSVLPHGPSSKSFAASARTHGFGVILQVPMEPVGAVADRTEPFLLRRGMTPEEIADRFGRMAADVPQANGASNHMGSAFTSDLAAMAAFAQVLKRKGFFFVDSVTSAGTVAIKATEEAGVPMTRRDVFLDADGRPEEMRRQWAAVIALAKKRGEAVLLCHARRETRKVLLELLPQLRTEGIRPVTVEELLASPARTAKEH
ncbi:MAG TPA: divergent polysaccharide deacetylase family protein [Candidatus Deferrimicrobium sp.]|nr:divergent polysaccharide deacetylase family protein [Candidatus Deferrimicrobium sp.]